GSAPSAIRKPARTWSRPKTRPRSISSTRPDAHGCRTGAAQGYGSKMGSKPGQASAMQSFWWLSPRAPLVRCYLTGRSHCREPLLIDGQMGVCGGEKRGRDARSRATREEVADNLLGLDRAALLQVAVHRRALGRTRCRQRLAGAFEEGGLR